jgi:membrane-associated phospholipid phosphatase
MIGFLQKTKVFSVPFFVLVGGLSLLLLFYTKVEIEIWVNIRNNPALDYFFKYFTHLGDGVTALVISLIFLLFNIRKGLILLISYLISGLFIQFLKILVFPDILRPVALMGQNYPLHLIEGVKIYSIQSFPSGHTGTAFAMFFCLAAFTSNKMMQLLALLTAILLAYSRMYLSQHFLPDVIGGAVIGTITSLLFLQLFEQKNLLSHLDHSLFSIKRTHAGQNN